jgi:hypothetical protein
MPAHLQVVNQKTSRQQYTSTIADKVTLIRAKNYCYHANSKIYGSRLGICKYSSGKLSFKVCQYRGGLASAVYPSFTRKGLKGFSRFKKCPREQHKTVSQRISRARFRQCVSECEHFK